MTTRKSEDGWAWKLASKAQDDLDALNPNEQQRIIDKPDEIIDSPWRDPPDYGVPLQNSPRRKVRIGEFRLAVTFHKDKSRIIAARFRRITVPIYRCNRRPGRGCAENDLQ
ncbi:type II toxin-antitoxin system RelE family toxin [Natronobacterium gregoryi]|uniref:Cytotoxic translational repressor of toxin-antitoxin stability system n=1 Tax=Natronobacterium gregoryi (strain ATCC 43098 / DSM 3393 / CCM 3738 / CIP 104747 / IAM 13177 / JCM 8860 / NBRC 102187 / NCIMB 2189 / SP2) TaxID=797304 RepID=L0ACD0_NATGS|nr:cytotoxic translational repressor of toxin-antitoxin stability system [Natronobacterium gregoryi SP2]